MAVSEPSPGDASPAPTPSPGNPPIPRRTGPPRRAVPPPPPPRPAASAPAVATASPGLGRPVSPPPVGDGDRSTGPPDAPRRPAPALALGADEASGARTSAGAAGSTAAGVASRADGAAGGGGGPEGRPRRWLARRPWRRGEDGAVLARAADRRPLRYRILPRSAIGISVSILAFALGASLSGVVLYSYYEYRLSQNEDRVGKLTSSLPATVKKAQDDLKAQEAQTQSLIQAQLAPYKSIAATGDTLRSLIVKVAPALYFVHTVDENGQPSVGTAFAVASDSHQTLLLTSYNVVRAATHRPGPPVYVRHASSDQAVTVYTWQQDKDLALIIMGSGDQPKLDFAASAPKPGERVFGLSGLGTQGASITQGFVADVSSEGIQHDATTGTQFQGGPLLNDSGQVVGILSRTYSPLNFPVADVWFAVPPKAACDKVLQCPNGTPASSQGAGGGQ